MTISLDLSSIAGFAAANPWAAIAIVFLLGVVLPGVWSRRGWRRHAAVTIIKATGEVITLVASAARRGRRP